MTNSINVYWENKAPIEAKGTFTASIPSHNIKGYGETLKEAVNNAIREYRFWDETVGEHVVFKIKPQGGN